MPNLGAGQPFSSERFCMSDAKAAAEVEGDSFADVEASRLHGSPVRQRPFLRGRGTKRGMTLIGGNAERMTALRSRRGRVAMGERGARAARRGAGEILPPGEVA